MSKEKPRPHFEYYLIDLSKYEDDAILNLKTHFLINALLAFKHKNDDDYVRKHFLRLFYNLEKYSDTEAGQRFTHYLSVYLVYATKISSKEVKSIFQKLPPKIEDLVMSTYDNILLEGLEQGLEKGLEKGLERGSVLEVLKGGIKSLEKSLDKDFILEIFEALDKDTLEILAVNVTNDFKVPVFQKALAAHLILTFKCLTEEDIAMFSKLELEEISKMKNNQ